MFVQPVGEHGRGALFNQIARAVREDGDQTTGLLAHTFGRGLQFGC
jgi:hypothetical protein